MTPAHNSANKFLIPAPTPTLQTKPRSTQPPQSSSDSKVQPSSITTNHHSNHKIKSPFIQHALLRAPAPPPSPTTTDSHEQNAPPPPPSQHQPHTSQFKTTPKTSSPPQKQTPLAQLDRHSTQPPQRHACDAVMQRSAAPGRTRPHSAAPAKQRTHRRDTPGTRTHQSRSHHDHQEGRLSRMRSEVGVPVPLQSRSSSVPGPFQ
ncbi:hypothetical protein M758_4G191400 [Ceratodon purpureus]|nr:hypothetical protein M758_4G191400 [Ceratodon purpureus]